MYNNLGMDRTSGSFIVIWLQLYYKYDNYRTYVIAVYPSLMAELYNGSRLRLS